MTNLEAAENFAKLGCNRNLLEPTCEAVEEDFLNSRCMDIRILNKNGSAPNGNEKTASLNSASNIFWEEAREMEKQKKLPRGIF